MSEEARSDFDHLPGVRAAQDRLLAHGERSYPTFDSLGILSHEDAYDFLRGTLGKYVPPENFGFIVGICLMFGVVCVEADREAGGAMTS